MKKFERISYKNFRLNKLNTAEFCHLKYLLYWPLFGVLFYSLERLWVRPRYLPVQCALDFRIPFCEFFLIPYLFWFVFLVGYMAYALFFDKESFKRFMQFTIVTYSAALCIYVLFPSCQQLRPLSFPRDNVLTAFMRAYYILDTNTNVCPSLHVIGSLAVMFSAGNSKHFSSRGWRLIFGISAALISVSTVFLKQHSVMDILAALPVCLAGYVLVFQRQKLHMLYALLTEKKKATENF